MRATLCTLGLQRRQAEFLSSNLLRSTTQAQTGQFCDQATIPSAATDFMTRKMIQWKTDDCATALSNDEVAPHPYPQV
jgi:hypothetical protein